MSASHRAHFESSVVLPSAALVLSSQFSSLNFWMVSKTALVKRKIAVNNQSHSPASDNCKNAGIFPRGGSGTGGSDAESRVRLWSRDIGAEVGGCLSCRFGDMLSGWGDSVGERARLDADDVRRILRIQLGESLRSVFRAPPSSLWLRDSRCLPLKARIRSSFAGGCRAVGRWTR